MADSSFDVVSEVNHPEVTNAVDQARREISTRFDFKGTNCEIELTKEELLLSAPDEGKLKQLIDVLQTKLIKRGVAVNALKLEDIEKGAGQSVRQKASFIAGIEAESAKKIHKAIKAAMPKVKSQSMDQKVRVTAKSKDDLQAVMQLLKGDKQIDIPLQFNNFR
ncbi:MAG: YajQ family cyclic di-GMP-binding protein [Leptospirales bacterium]